MQDALTLNPLQIQSGIISEHVWFRVGFVFKPIGVQNVRMGTKEKDIKSKGFV